MASKIKALMERNRPCCKAYRAENRRERSTIRKLLRRVENTIHGLMDGSAVERLRALTTYAEKAHATRITAVWERFNSAEGKTLRADRAAIRAADAGKSAQMRRDGVKPRAAALPSAA